MAHLASQNNHRVLDDDVAYVRLVGLLLAVSDVQETGDFTVVVDEYGNYRWTQNPIPRVQKVERYILLAVMGLFALWVIGVVIGSGQNGSGQNAPKYSGETTSLSRTVRGCHMDVGPSGIPTIAVIYQRY